jgi:hypothetical protein
MTPAFLGEAMQIAFVARDIEKLIHSWTKVLKVGPFALITDAPPVHAIYHGKDTYPKILMGWSFLGTTQIAILQQLNDAPTPQLDFINSGREGIEHIGFWPPKPAAVRKHLVKMGYQHIYEVPGAGATSYFEPPAGLGVRISILEPVPVREKIYRALKKRAQNWNGRKGVYRYKTNAEFMDDLGVKV